MFDQPFFSGDSALERPFHGKTLLLIHIGSDKKAFIPKRMKELGVRIVALHTERAAWAEPFVDDWILASQKDNEQTIVEKVRAYQQEHAAKPIDGAVTFWEEEVPTLARICKTCGFIGNAPETSFYTRSKFHMQETLRAGGCNAMRQALVSSPDDLEAAMRSIGFPAVLKPLYGSDSLFVTFVDNVSNGRDAYDYVRDNYRKHPYELLSRYECGTFVYQEYIAGTEFSVECYAQNGMPYVLGMHQKTSMHLPFFMETGDIVPPQVAPDVRLQLEEQSKKALIALGVTDSLAHVEIKWASRGPQVIEVASRMGGDYTWHNMRSIYNADLVQIACDIALGISVPEKAHDPSEVLIGHFFIPPESGAIVSITGADAFANNPDVKLFFSGRAGEEIRVPPDGFDSVGWVCVKGKTLADAEQLLELVKRTVVMDVATPDDLPGTPNRRVRATPMLI